MAKSKLTKEIISFIIDKYECPTKTYTFPEIAELILEKYGVEVSRQAVHKSYHKYKNDSPKSVISRIKPPISEKNSFQRVEKQDVDKQPVQTTGFNDNAGDTLSRNEIKDLLD